jgi:hypothetical protein
MANLETPDIPQKQKKLYSPVIISILGAVFLLWLILLFTSNSFYNDFGMDLDRDMWVNIGSFIMVIFIIVLLVAALPKRTPTPEASGQFTSISPGESATPKQGVVITSSQPAETAPTAAVMEAEPLVVEAEVVEVEPIEVEEIDTKSPLPVQKPKLVEYPKKVPGGVYGDTIIRVDPVTKLNLRTLLVRSCMICDRQGKCWDEFMDTVGRNDFLENIDCKKGLRQLRGGTSEEAPKMLKKKTRKRIKRK